MLLKHALTALTLACTTLSAAVLPANGLAALESQNDLKILTGLIKKDPYLVNLYKTTKDVTIVAAIDSSFPIKDINDPLYSRDFVRLIAVALLIEGIYPSSAVTTDPKYPSTKQDDPNYAKTSRGKVPARLQTKNGKDTVKYNYVTSDFVQNVRSFLPNFIRPPQSLLTFVLDGRISSPPIIAQLTAHSTGYPLRPRRPAQALRPHKPPRFNLRHRPTQIFQQLRSRQSLVPRPANPTRQPSRHHRLHCHERRLGRPIALPARQPEHPVSEILRLARCILPEHV